MAYGRARLLLGVSGVGMWVVLAAVVLVAGLPEWLTRLTSDGLRANAFALFCLAMLVVMLQAPFDLFGGHILPRRHGRSSERFVMFAKRWLRGVAIYQSIYLLIGLLLLLASRVSGVSAMVVVGVAASVAMLAVRTPLASFIGYMTRSGTEPDLGDDVDVIGSSDQGFTGGIAGVLRARTQLVPAMWRKRLSPDMLSLALLRRREAVTSGLWLRGRVASLLFIWIGLAISGTQVGGQVGTAGGVLAFGACFTLWSFLGLLVLPTLSRRASIAIDDRLAAHGVAQAGLNGLASALDSMQDGEPSRPRWIETIFHPIPSVTSRSAERKPSRFAAWDVARTSAYLGLAGLSPLGRAVHCNSGRPPLWVYLPSD